MLRRILPLWFLRSHPCWLRQLQINLIDLLQILSRIDSWKKWILLRDIKMIETFYRTWGFNSSFDLHRLVPSSLFLWLWSQVYLVYWFKTKSNWLNVWIVKNKRVKMNLSCINLRLGFYFNIAVLFFNLSILLNSYQILLTTNKLFLALFEF